MALTTGKPPLRVTDETHPDEWDLIDLDIVSKWQIMKNSKCPGCGRPLSQHLNNPLLGREESVEDYKVWSVDCPAVQAIAVGQEMWRKANNSALKSFYDGKGSDPSAGVYWLAQGVSEILPTDEE